MANTSIIPGSSEVGLIGEVHPDIIGELGLRARTTVFELDFALVLEDIDLERNYQPLLRYPSVERDLAIMVKKEIKCGDLLARIRKQGGGVVTGSRSV